MDAQQIVKDIEDKREQLSENLSALEIRVRDATNWRVYFNRSPWLMMGAALMSGWLVSSVLIPSRRERC
jgi:hypothetical protein